MLSIILSVIALSISAVNVYIVYAVYVDTVTPNVIIYIEQNQQAKALLTLTIKNIGKGVAKNIKIIPSRAVFITGEQKLTEELFYLPPNTSRTFTLGKYEDVKKWMGDDIIEVKIIAERDKKLIGYNEFVITSSLLEITSLARVDASDNSNLKKIKEELKNINSSIKQISTNMMNNS